MIYHEQLALLTIEALSIGLGVFVFVTGIIYVLFSQHLKNFLGTVQQRSVAHTDSLEELGSILNEDIRFSQVVPPLLQKLREIFKPASIEFIVSATGEIFELEGELSTGIQPEILRRNAVHVNVMGNDRTIGVFTLGPKNSGYGYSEEELLLLRTFASHASAAFGKIELYEELEDYSELLEQKVEDRTQNLRDLQKYQRQLFDDISHALQTPVTVLKSGLELLAVPRLEQGQVHESLAQGVDDLSQLVQNLLELARIDAIPLEEHQELVDLSALVSDVVEYVETICYEKDIMVIKRIEPEITVIGHARQVRDVVINLLSNAVKYTEQCTTRAITVLLTTDAEHSQLTISDTGIGIAKERLSRLFDRFYRAHDTSGQGCGLGLAISKRIVDRHGGEILIRSKLEKGTTVTVRFPQEKIPRVYLNS